ncbi:MAG: phosphotransferase [Pseudomonadota bacterium]
MTDGEAGDDRSVLAEAFVDKYGWSEAERTMLDSNAWDRPLIRLVDRTVEPHSQAVFMDWQAPGIVLQRFMRMQELLLSLGITTPKTLARDMEHGFMLVEDFGEDLYSKLIDNGEDAKPLLTQATKLLIALQKRFAEPMGRGLKEYDAATYADQAALFLDAYMRGADLLPEDPMELQELVEIFLQVWEAAMHPVYELPQTLIVRDYIPENLMRIDVSDEDNELAEPSGLRQIGVLNFQDGGIGPGIYDLVSLLEDVRRDVHPDLTRAMIQGYLKSFPDIDPAQFQTAYNILKAQRLTRVLGTFARAAIDEGDDSNMQYIPRCWQLLEDVLEKEPELDGVRAWFDRNVPAEFRANLVNSG